MANIKRFSMSKGEREVFLILKKLRVTFYRETHIKDCRGDKKSLPFDFSVFIDDKLAALIEYNGCQHYIPSFSTEDWEKIKKTDEIKAQYCKENNIPLLVVPYFKFKETERLVTDFLRINGVLKSLKKVAI